MTTHQSSALARRTALLGAAAAGGLALAACSTPSGSVPAPAEPIPSAPPPSAAPPSAATPSAPAAVGSKGTELGPASEVPVGGGHVYAALEVVVTQPQAGVYRGFSAICTHTGCIVEKVDGGTIDCPCHGSRYHLDGTVANGPAPRALPRRAVTVVNGQVVLT